MPKQEQEQEQGQEEEITSDDHAPSSVVVDMPFDDVQESDIVNEEGTTEEHLPDEEEKDAHEERPTIPGNCFM